MVAPRVSEEEAAPEDEPEWDVPPLTDEEILGAIKFLTSIYADWQRDDFYRMTPEEEAEVPGAIREMLPQNDTVSQAVRTLDLGGKYGILLRFVGRRALHAIRKKREQREIEQQHDDTGPEVVRYDQG